MLRSWRAFGMAVGASFWLPSCHSTESVELPFVEGAKSAVLVERSSEFQSAQAFATGESPPSISARVGLEVSIVQFRCSLSALGLEPGVQELLDEPVARSPLPTPTHSAQLSFESLAWQDSPVSQAAHEILGRLPVARARICSTAGTQVSARSFTVDLGAPFADVGVVAALGDGTAILSSNVGRFYRVDTTGQADSIEIVVPGVDRVPASAGFFDGRELWLAGSGTVAHGTLEDGFEILPGRAPGIGAHLALTGAEGELFLGDYERLFRYRGDWQEASFPNPMGCLRPLEPRIAALGDGRALAAVAWRSLELTRSESALVGFAPPPRFTSSEEVGSSVARTRSLGPLIGTLIWNPVRFAVNGGYLHRWTESGAFVRVEDSYTETVITNIAELGDLVLFGGAPGEGANSAISRYHPVAGLCDAEELAGDIRGMVALDDEHLLIAQSRSPTDSRSLRYSILTRTKPSDPCLGSGSSE